ncbi:MAG TPA: hypothetical protein VHI13_05015 [Candidatus Kapabacteria bacterium]|nr:hypothetical protein [Candidatus Kapabacteria bacterium]
MTRRPIQFRILDPQHGSDPQHGERSQRHGDRHALGPVIWLAMLRLTATIFGSWYIRQYIPSSEYGVWWGITIAAIYGIAIYPAQIQYSHFKRINRRLIEQTLCSSCRYFNPEGLHCMQLDEIVSEDYLPCHGEGWEPKSFDDVA